MSLVSQKVLISRLELAKKDSPIGVLSTMHKTKKNEPLFDAFFAATVTAKHHIENNKDEYLGSFYRGTIDGAIIATNKETGE